MIPALKYKALQGGIHLALRQLLGVCLSVVSVLVVARLLGPQQYGIYAIAAGVLYFTIETSRLGLDIYLIRTPALPIDAARQILAFYNTVGLLLCLLLWLSVSLAGPWIANPDIQSVLQWLVPIVWLGMISSIPIAMMERELQFDRVGLVEALSQTANCLVTVGLVVSHWGFWGPIAGLGTQFVVLSVLAFRFHPIPLGYRWQTPLLRSALRTSLMYVGSNWIWSLKSLTVPLLVSHLAGLRAVGILSIAIRLAEQLGILRTVAYRLSISTLSRLQGDSSGMCRVISRGLTYQGLLVGPLYAIFSCISAWLIPMLFGQDWLISTQIFPFVALGILVNTCFNLHSSALYAAGCNRAVAVFHLWHIGLLWSSLWFLSPVLGFWSYAAAEGIALLSYLAIHRSLVRLCGSPDYKDACWLLVATVPTLFAGPWLPTPISVSLLVASYALLFSLRPGFRGIPLELYTAWRSPKQMPAIPSG